MNIKTRLTKDFLVFVFKNNAKCQIPIHPLGLSYVGHLESNSVLLCILCTVWSLPKAKSWLTKCNLLPLWPCQMVPDCTISPSEEKNQYRFSYRNVTANRMLCWHWKLFQIHTNRWTTCIILHKCTVKKKILLEVQQTRAATWLHSSKNLKSMQRIYGTSKNSCCT